MQAILNNDTTKLLEAEPGKTWSSFSGLVPIENIKDVGDDTDQRAWSDANGIEVKKG